MNRFVGLVCLTGVFAAQFAGQALAQDALGAGGTVPTPAVAGNIGAIVLPRNTPVRLMVMTEVSTKVDTVGHKFRLSVDEPISLDGRIVIPEGTIAWGEVTSAESSGNLGKNGTLSARLLYIDLAGNHIAITGETQTHGKGGGGEAAYAVFSLGLAGLFAKGNNAKIKAGERMTALTAEDAVFPPPVLPPVLPQIEPRPPAK